MPTLHLFDYLEAPERHAVPAVVVLFGDEAFLKGLALRHITAQVLGPAEDAPATTVEASTVEWRDVLDELSTPSLFSRGGRRLVVLRDADDFVSDHRPRLEDYVAQPRAHGVLLLEVASWASNTRLYKAVDKEGLQLDCGVPQKSAGKRKVPDEARLRKWLIGWAAQQHDVVLQSAAAQLLTELAGQDLGRLDQELAKLALFAGPQGKVTPELVRDVVGGWQTKTTWELVDLAADGDAGAALEQLDRLLQSAEHPLALLAQISWSLRRYAVAVRIFEDAERRGRKMALTEALIGAGFRRWPPEALQRAEKQLRQLGRQRALQVPHWLLEADLALKGSHSPPTRARMVLELLLVRLARALGPQPSQAAR